MCNLFNVTSADREFTSAFIHDEIGSNYNLVSARQTAGRAVLRDDESSIGRVPST